MPRWNDDSQPPENGVKRDNASFVGQTGRLIAIRLKEARTKLGLLLKQVADEVHVSVAYLSELEHGRKENPSEDLIYRLAQVLRVTPGFLKGDDLRRRNEQIRQELGEELYSFFHRFGLQPHEVSELFGAGAGMIRVALQAVISLQQRHAISQEEMLSEVYRHLVGLNPDHFERIEADAARLRASWEIEGDLEAGEADSLEVKLCQRLAKLGVQVRTHALSRPGEGIFIHSMIVGDASLLLLDVTLSPYRRCFSMVRELICRELGLISRSMVIPPHGDRVLETLSNDARAWQIAVTLMLPVITYRRLVDGMLQASSLEEIRDLLIQELQKPGSIPPEHLLVRIVQLMHLERRHLPLLTKLERLSRATGRPTYSLCAHELPVSPSPKRSTPHAPMCARWTATRLLEELARTSLDRPVTNPKPGLVVGQASTTPPEEPCLVGIQRERTAALPREQLSVALAFRELDRLWSVSMTLPLDAFPRLQRGLDAPETMDVDIGEVCDHCELYDRCPDRSEHALRDRILEAQRNFDNQLRRIRCEVVEQAMYESREPDLASAPFLRVASINPGLPDQRRQLRP